MNRYAVGGEDEFEPGSEGRVLKNKLGIVDPIVVGRIETSLLAECYARNLRTVVADLVMDRRTIQSLHADWLSPLYAFAGKLREVNVSKDGFLFAPAAYLPQGLAELEATMSRMMPCSDLPFDNLAQAIAVIHAELMLLHPFREGNGRVGRLIADLMAAQGGYSTLRWGFDQEKRRESYLVAMRRGAVMDYEPIVELVREALRSAGRRDPLS